MEARALISVLIHMSLDKPISLFRRREYLYLIAKSKGIKKNEVDYLMNYPEAMPYVEGLDEDNKFEYLYTAVQFLKYDRKIRQKELQFCQKMAKSMGFSPQIVYELSTFIYSDPKLSVKLNFLKKLSIVYSTYKGRVAS